MLTNFSNFSTFIQPILTNETSMERSLNTLQKNSKVESAVNQSGIHFKVQRRPLKPKKNCTDATIRWESVIASPIAWNVQVWEKSTFKNKRLCGKLLPKRLRMRTCWTSSSQRLQFCSMKRFDPLCHYLKQFWSSRGLEIYFQQLGNWNGSCFGKNSLELVITRLLLRTSGVNIDITSSVP